MQLFVVVLALLAAETAFGLKLSNNAAKLSNNAAKLSRTATVGALSVLLSGPVSFTTQQQGDSPFTRQQPLQSLPSNFSL
jgi:hypothetical protein